MTAETFDYSHRAVTADQTTPYLCAEVHLDQLFCDKLIDEFVSEPLRAIPPSPGVNDAVVLGAAVAARTRRRLRDTVLCFLFALLAISNIKLFIVWLVLAMLWRVVRARTTSTGWMGSRSDRESLVLLLAIAVLAYILYTADVPVAPPAVDSASLLVLMAMYGVLVVDRLVEWRIVTTSFRRDNSGKPVGNEARQTDKWWVRGLMSAVFLKTFEGIDKKHEDRNVIVYRGEDPFVGAGVRVQNWSMAIPLAPEGSEKEGSDDAALLLLPDKSTRNEGLRFKPGEIYEHVASEFEELRTALSLAPSKRFSSLDVGDIVVVSADELLDHHDDKMAQLIHPVLSERPRSKIGREEPDGHKIAELADEPIEWIRYFKYCRVESWDRDLVVSGFLHIGCDDRMLYLEWSAYVLCPIKDRFRRIDEMSTSQWRPLRQAGGDLLEFPSTLPDRVRSITRPIRDGSVPASGVTASMIGACQSIRELAASGTLRNYFQRSDTERYVKIMERHTLGAIAGFLKSKNISTRALIGQANTIINNSVSGNLYNSSMSGDTKNNNSGPARKGAGSESTSSDKEAAR